MKPMKLETKISDYKERNSNQEDKQKYTIRRFDEKICEHITSVEVEI